MSRRRGPRPPAVPSSVNGSVVRVVCTDRGRHRRRLITHLMLFAWHEADGGLPWVLELGPAPALGLGPEVSMAETFQAEVSSGNRPTRRRFSFTCGDLAGHCNRKEDLREERLVRVLAAAYKIHVLSGNAPGGTVEWDISHHELIQYSKP